MPKESDALENDSNKSKIVQISPDNSEEEVFSSEEQIDALTYESRLNDKLKELDLYEDDMTIQQKEELLAVVVASWESAEKEKTRRQFYQQYEAASEAFISDQPVEFSFNPAQIPLPRETPCCSSDFTADVSHQSSESPRKPVFSSNSSELQILPSSPLFSSTTNSEHELFHKGRTRNNRKTRFSCTVTEENEDSQASSADMSIMHQPSLEQSLSQWKPCLSPKEKPLSSKKRPWLNKKPPARTLTEPEFTDQVSRLTAELTVVSRELRSEKRDRWTYSKPYHLNHRRFFTKRPGKPDPQDVNVGVPDEDVLGTSQEIIATDLYSDPRLLCEATPEVASPLAEPVPLADPRFAEQRIEEPCVVVEETLPRFNHVAGSSGVDQECDLLVNGRDGALNHVNSSCMESNSSECSSVIDVEAIVDEEIEEFVLKRKLIQTCPSSEQESTSCQSKKLKKSSS